MNLIKKNIFITTVIALFFGCNMAVAMKQEEKQFNEVEQPEKIFEGHKGAISDMLLVDNVLVSSSFDGSVKVWDATTGKCLRTVLYSNAITNLVYLEKKTIAILSRGKITFLNLKTGKCSSTTYLPDTAEICSGLINKSLYWVYPSLSSSPSSYIKFMDIKTLKKAENPITLAGCILTMLSGGNNFVITAVIKKSPWSIQSMLLDTTTGKIHSTFSDAPIAIVCATNIDNNILAFSFISVDPSKFPPSAMSKSSDYMLKNSDIRLWDIKNDKPLKLLTGHKEIVCALTYLGENILISESEDNTIKFWDIQSGICLKEIDLTGIIKIKQPQSSISLASIFEKLLNIKSDKPLTKICKLVGSLDKKFLFAGLSDGRILKLKIPQAFWPKEQFSKKLFGELKNKNPKPDISFKFGN